MDSDNAPDAGLISDPVPDHPLLRGRREIGRGESTIVVEADTVEGEERVEETLLTVPGNYPAYYAAIRDALNGDGENPVPASQAIQVMELIELGIESAKHRATLCLA